MPSPDRGGFATQMLLEAIQQFDRPLFPSCAQKFQKLRVGPDQGHYAPCGFAWFQSALPQRRSVPDLLGDKPGRMPPPHRAARLVKGNTRRRSMKALAISIVARRDADG
jgi:hypothetical protein